MGQEVSKNTYSVTVYSDEGRDKSDNCGTIQEVIQYVVDCMGWYEYADNIHQSEISVYISGTDDLVAFKRSPEAIEDFIIELCNESRSLDEKNQKSSSEWLKKLDKNMGTEKVKRFIDDCDY